MLLSVPNVFATSLPFGEETTVRLVCMTADLTEETTQEVSATDVPALLHSLETELIVTAVM